MMMKNYNAKSLVRQGLRYLCRALNNGYSYKKAREDLRKLVNSYSGLNKDERFLLYNELYKLYRVGKSYYNGAWQKKIGQCKSYDMIWRAARRVERSKKLRDKQAAIRSMLNDEDKVFFLCTVHDHPAEGHREWQGKIYVDRFWRTKVKGDKYYPVLSYIRNRKIHTVQWVMGDPVWMTTRPYCKHYFIPLSIDEVLSSSPKVIAERHRYKAADKDDYYDHRAKVYSELAELYGFEEFERIFSKKRVNF